VRGEEEFSLEPAPGLDAVREEWTRLADAAGSPFSTWEWASVWWRHYGGRGEQRLRVCRDGEGRAFAILPLYHARRGPLRVLRMIGHGPADQLQPVCAPGDRPLAAAALRRALDDGDERWDVALLDRLPGEDGWPELLGAQVERRESSPVLDAGGAGFEDWLRAQSRNFREQVRRRERRLAREHDLAFRLCDDADRFDDDYATLVRLHRARFGSQSRAFDPPRQDLHREFAREALHRGWLRLWILELGGRPAAAWLGYRMGGSEWYYQAGRDAAFERESVGFVLMVHTIREALDAGMRQYRLLLGDEPYKARFANADHGLDTVLCVRGAKGRAARAAARGAKRVPRPLRRSLRRLAG
jgi:CelD/BcsL family acetyltransferase involved in cellulose biosynthesis